MQYRILIVEDDKDTASAEAMTLEKLGFYVAVVNHGDQALPKMKEWKPDIVILDLELPGKNGFEILQQMFFDQELRNTIVIANTIHMDAKDNLGFAYYAHYQRIKNEEPMMVNKLQTEGEQQIDLPLAIADMMGQKFRVIPKALGDYLKKKGKWNPRWEVV